MRFSHRLFSDLARLAIALPGALHGVTDRGNLKGKPEGAVSGSHNSLVNGRPREITEKQTSLRTGLNMLVARAAT